MSENDGSTPPPGTDLEPAQLPPISIEELFDRDPMELTREDTETIVMLLRRQRKNFMTASEAKDTGQVRSRKVKDELAPAKPAKAAKAKPTGPITLEGLGLGTAQLTLPAPKE